MQVDEKRDLGEETVHEWGHEYSNEGVAIREFVVNSWMVVCQRVFGGEVRGWWRGDLTGFHRT